MGAYWRQSLDECFGIETACKRTRRFVQQTPATLESVLVSDATPVSQHLYLIVSLCRCLHLIHYLREHGRIEYRQRRTGRGTSWKEDEARAPQRANNLRAYVGASLDKCIK